MRYDFPVTSHAVAPCRVGFSSTEQDCMPLHDMAHSLASPHGVIILRYQSTPITGFCSTSSTFIWWVRLCVLVFKRCGGRNMSLALSNASIIRSKSSCKLSLSSPFPHITHSHHSQSVFYYLFLFYTYPLKTCPCSLGILPVTILLLICSFNQLLTDEK